MPFDIIHARASLEIRHERPFYDEERRVWRRERLDDGAIYGNILTNGGRVALHTFIYGTASQRTAQNLGTGLNFIALTDDAAAPDAADTALTGELTADGLGRVEGTVMLPTGVGTITQVQHMFTYTGGATQGVQKTALFDASSAGNMAHEIAFPQRVLATSDTLTLVFRITLT